MNNASDNDCWSGLLRWPWLVVMTAAQRFGRQFLYPVMVFPLGLPVLLQDRGVHTQDHLCVN
jgi:hypothetical protein